MNHNRASGEADLGRDPIGRLLFNLALPAITAQIINLLYNMVDRMYIGHIPDIGPDALTGVGVTMPVIMCISAFAALVSMGGAPRASIMMGKGRPDEAERILGNCASMLFFISVTLTAFFLLFGRSVLLMFGASENTILYAWPYMQIYACGTIFVQMSLGLNAFINAQGFAKIGMVTVAIGAALATIISQSVSCVWILRFLTGPKTTLRIRPANLRPDAGTVGACVSLGLSPFIMQFTESILSVCFNTSLLKYGGDIAVGAMTILTSVMQFSMLPLQGLTQGVQPIISFNYGAGNIARVKQAFHLLLRVSLCYSTFLWAICMFLPQAPIAIFTNNEQLAQFTMWAMRIYMAASLIFAIQISCQQTFIALGNAKTSVFLALLRKVILLIPLIFILPGFFENKVMAVFIAEPVADVIAVSVTASLFFLEYRKLGET